ncbi:hypothetical protein SEA_SYDNAT_46 [Mycobacterium phage SydNat]|uniref:Uncharacterized protein n=1 Tax=Mycobacterium phage Zolita TaxID=2593355 RepID=A0A514U2I7_9CAUD|nr:hypothetical protein KIP50_gp46 [Mycobacterium phage Zolita]QDK03168.1 hypothetical protein SEA_ZOLITA_45 [Mycobacterium phage Zolita]UVK64266.1 hypothetical protein SEA_SYDNAT_46 [Mycobacterium phage SydNat]UVK64352.1 hypothetical protein SEA_GHOULBOY_46 [Mycobacterium phage Ghoulboy]
MTKLFPSHVQLTALNLQEWIEKFGPLRKVNILNPENEGQPFELELVFGE